MNYYREYMVSHHNLRDTKMSFKASIIKSVWDRQQNRQKDQ